MSYSAEWRARFQTASTRGFDVWNVAAFSSGMSAWRASTATSAARQRLSARRRPRGSGTRGSRTGRSCLRARLARRSPSACRFLGAHASWRRDRRDRADRRAMSFTARPATPVVDVDDRRGGDDRAEVGDVRAVGEAPQRDAARTTCRRCACAPRRDGGRAPRDAARARSPGATRASSKPAPVPTRRGRGVRRCARRSRLRRCAGRGHPRPGVRAPRPSVVMTSRVPSAWSTVMRAMKPRATPAGPGPAVDQCVTNANALRASGVGGARDIGGLVVLLVGIRERRTVRDATPLTCRSYC